MKIILFVLIPLILSIGIIPSFAEHMGPHHDEQMGQHGMMGSMMGNHHMSYKGMCGPGFASLDGMCVLDDRCGPGAYPGKICMMDGMMKQYLKPDHQKYAGISVDNIICAEGKHLMFKHHDSSPACVNSTSVEKLQNRGWQTEKPVMACTMEYDPICGVDGVTYGNMCGLKTQHMAMNHRGECGKLAELVIEPDISKMQVKDIEKIVEKTIKEDELDAFNQESISKIREAVELIYSPEIQSVLKDSNEEFAALDDIYVLIDERNDEWILAEDDEVTPFMDTLLGNKASIFLQMVVNKDKMKPTDFVYEEIILTNAYGANVAQTGKTTDYKQWDEQWWILSKQNGVSMKSGFDESAGVQSLDMSFRIQDENGIFLGVAKFVINTEKLY